MTITIPSTLHLLRHERWPTAAEPPAVPGFIVSSFNPLVAAVAGLCLDGRPEEPHRRTGLVLASESGDAGTAREVADAVATGRRVAPLLFFQSNPNAVLGHVAARHRLDGPIVCLGPLPGGRSIRDRALAEAELLLLDGDADEVLVVLVEQDPDSTAEDTAEALLLRGHLPGKEAP
ncbi:beta-ketoacyl synthase chain length factor [Actinospica robiniae]|uniref:beta-ketoacyl synthase chain length factor n=1 Tax=Actinospica robiniae TaxID=304901 RepID=UPI0004217DF2|nr:beta-ketoacyl synthase chain length factor [Actinospica robiniae]